MYKKPLVILGLVWALSANVWGNTQAAKTSVEFQVIQAKLVFDQSTIQSAVIHSPGAYDGGQYNVTVTLKPEAAAQFEKLTQANIHKTANIIMNNQIVSAEVIATKLSSSFQIRNLTQQQAQQFVSSVTAKTAVSQ
jgi:preprotein translocase subunit SecD